MVTSQPRKPLGKLNYMDTVSPFHFIVLLLVMLIPVAFGWLCASMAKKKDRSVGGFFALGFFLGIIGVIIAAVISPGTPSPPPGLRAVTCPRCNARQNLNPGEPSYECCQCKTGVSQ